MIVMNNVDHISRKFRQCGFTAKSSDRCSMYTLAVFVVAFLSSCSLKNVEIEIC